MKVDLLVGEIGSTTTLVNAFDHINSANPRFVGQGRALTSLDQSDVFIGLQQAISNLAEQLGETHLDATKRLSTSSAAGGLRMSVHGLAYEMTVRAAKEGALGAGAVVKMVTAGVLNSRQLKKLTSLRPNLILLAGGVDYGDEEVAWTNAQILAKLLANEKLAIPLVYAGNVTLQQDIMELFTASGLPIFVCGNVYPKIDQLEVDELRAVIQQVFAKHIVTAPGMEKVRDWSSGLLPTPAGVMESAQLLAADLGDLAVVDVGGATTDVHSVAEGSKEVQSVLLAPEPKAKRTVEGDLGVYKNAPQLQLMSAQSEVEPIQPIPKGSEEIAKVLALAETAVNTAIKRHAGQFVYRFGVNGRERYASGKDLTAVGCFIGTGGVFSHLDPTGLLIKKALSNIKDGLLPTNEVEILIDHHYIMASVGTFAKLYPKAALALLKGSLHAN